MAIPNWIDDQTKAKIKLKKYDILISKIRGCLNKFCIILEDNKYFVATNGFYRIRIKNELDRRSN